MLNSFLGKLNQSPEQVQFEETMAVIDAAYDFTPCEFKNGEQINQAGQNSGSCKIFAFAKENELSEELTLQCFGDFYRKDVLQNPQGADHQNIRNFMVSGWSGISFTASPLKLKA